VGPVRVDVLLTGAAPQTVEAAARITAGAAPAPRLWLPAPQRDVELFLVIFRSLRLGVWIAPDECVDGPRWIRTRSDGRLSVCFHQSVGDDRWKRTSDPPGTLVLEGVPASALPRIAGASRVLSQRAGAGAVGLVLPISYGPAEVALRALRASLLIGPTSGWWRHLDGGSDPFPTAPDADRNTRISDADVRDFGAVSDQALCDRVMLAKSLGFATVVLAPVAPIAEMRDGRHSADLHAVTLAAQLNAVLTGSRPPSRAPEGVR
jgi:hypothetical protein